MIEFYMIEIN